MTGADKQISRHGDSEGQHDRPTPRQDRDHWRRGGQHRLPRHIKVTARMMLTRSHQCPQPRPLPAPLLHGGGGPPAPQQRALPRPRHAPRAAALPAARRGRLAHLAEEAPRPHPRQGEGDGGSVYQCYLLHSAT